MMPRRALLLATAMLIGAIALVPCPARAQTATIVVGSVFVYNPSGSHPVPAVGYKVYLYNWNSGWIGPAVTDGYGRFAFYNIRYDTYLLRINARAVNTPVFQEQIRVPGHINPIILRQP
jgi:hypothetical protein